MFIDNNPKLSHSKKYILLDIEEKLISKNKYTERDKLTNIPNIIIKVEPLRPNILPNDNIVIAVNNGRNIIIKYKLYYMIIIS